VSNAIHEKGGGTFEGVRLLLCENPLPPIDEALEAAQEQLPLSNFYTEAFSAPLRQIISNKLNVHEKYIHINAGSELILRQLFNKFGQQVHLITPTYVLFTEIADSYTETKLEEHEDFKLDLATLKIPENTSLAVIVNPNNPNGFVFDMSVLPELLAKYSQTKFIVDEAFIGVAGKSVVGLVPEYNNLIVTRTLSKAHSLAGFRIGYAILPEELAMEMNQQNDAYPLARPSEAAAIATLQNENKIISRVETLKQWTQQLAEDMQGIGIKTYPTETYFFLANFAPHDAFSIAQLLADSGFLVKPLNDPALGEGYIRITTSTPENNRLFVSALRAILSDFERIE
jgi:histidinol-phosphate aminotransferase